MKVVTLTNGQFAENCYLVIDEHAKLAAVVDPGEGAQLILARLATEEVETVEIWITHAHVDHVAGAAAVHAATGAPVRLHPEDVSLYRATPAQAAWLGVAVADPPEPSLTFTAGDRVTVGSLGFDVHHTPGHSPGSVSLVGHGVAFVGDVLFAGSVGRVDLPGGSGAALLESIQHELLPLPDETVVYAGHGPATTIGRERRSNPFLTGAARLA